MSIEYNWIYPQWNRPVFGDLLGRADTGLPEWILSFFFVIFAKKTGPILNCGLHHCFNWAGRVINYSWSEWWNKSSARDWDEGIVMGALTALLVRMWWSDQEEMLPPYEAHTKCPCSHGMLKQGHRRRGEGSRASERSYMSECKLYLVLHYPCELRQNTITWKQWTERHSECQE